MKFVYLASAQGKLREVNWQIKELQNTGQPFFNCSYFKVVIYFMGVSVWLHGCMCTEADPVSLGAG